MLELFFSGQQLVPDPEWVLLWLRAMASDLKVLVLIPNASHFLQTTLVQAGGYHLSGHTLNSVMHAGATGGANSCYLPL